ncbi:Abhydrolase domain-containing 12 [Mycena sanguinolenta]|uniref:Abhydrolase domain-containing 12 n=1 Tax=Mycena sanguinolenta TaxID=230812 RepID=A0A8H6YES8_9AGAR|nr:Abhydrolase domain-containing 12 [Mycena sanguinolenta]
MPFLSFSTARKIFAGLGGLYVATVVLLTIPYFQTHTLFLHAVKLPFFANFDVPELYGLAPNKTINLRIETADNESLGAWFVLSDSFYHSLPTIPSQPSDLLATALNARPTILFFHGNAATRALGARIQHYTGYSSRLAANVLVIDYRGFADSTGTPTQPGLARDARAAWNWLIKNGASADQILIMGHSLGTGVSSLLAAELSDEGISPRGLVLLSPFSSITKLLETYSIFGVVPLIKPLAMVPWVAKMVLSMLVHTFETDTLVPRIKGPVLIAHAGKPFLGFSLLDLISMAENDWEIPYSHSQALFDAFLDPLLPTAPQLPANAAAFTQEEWSLFMDRVAKRKDLREGIVTTVELRNFGTVHEFTESGRKVTFVHTRAGGHDYLGIQEGLHDIIGRNFGFFGH